MKCLLRSLGQIQCAKEPQCLSLNQGFLSTLTWGAIVTQSLHLTLQTKIFPPPQSKVFWTNERDDIRPQTSNNRAPVVRSLYCPFSQNRFKKALLKITVNSQGQLNLFSLIVGSSVTPMAHHNIAWHLGIGDEYFAGAAVAQW